jgi:hypothetical protein
MRTGDLIRACYARLNTPSVTNLLTSAYGVPAVFQIGKVPQTPAQDPLAFPFITFGVTSNVNFSDKLNLGGEAVLQIDVWDRSGSNATLGDIMNAAALATVRQAWSIPGFITCEFESDAQVADPDGLTMHGIILVKVLFLDTGNPWASQFSVEFG